MHCDYFHELVVPTWYLSMQCSKAAQLEANSAHLNQASTNLRAVLGAMSVHHYGILKQHADKLDACGLFKLLVAWLAATGLQACMRM